MNIPPKFAAVGRETSTIDVRLSYKIVDLFSEGLYSSPNKAVEELVANSFDAGATRVAVFVPADFHTQDATIAVLDNGEGMDGEGLNQHWLIGTSNKRSLTKLPKNRQQIGMFGIGKLATYVLANRLTHICKKNKKYYSTSMDYQKIDDRVGGGVEPKTPIKIPLRELTESEAKSAISPWLQTATFKSSKLKLFGKGATSSWTLAILSNLKAKAIEIAPGTLGWVLSTALPLRPDFEIHYEGRKLVPSKLRKGRIKRWVIGKDIKNLDKPAPKEMEASIDRSQPQSSEHRFGFHHPSLGRVTGYMEIYKDLLTGKSDAIARSHGIFVYVRQRLVNIIDGHFGISPNDLERAQTTRSALGAC